MVNIRISQKIKIALVYFLIAFLLVGILLYREPLKNATTGELDGINGIRDGGIIMAKIQHYIIENPQAKVEDLRQIKGVDNHIISQLKERFR